MSAGTGVRHSEFNPSNEKPTHFLQIWILPAKEGLNPGYEQKSFAKELASSDLVLVASSNGDKSSLRINQDANLYVCHSSTTVRRDLVVNEGRKLWVQVVHGPLRINEFTLANGDGAAIDAVKKLSLEWENGSEFLLFDLPI